jgi:hypothetical protein
LEGRSNFIISGEGSFEFISSDRYSDDEKKIYTILPAKNSITIANFNTKRDQISLFHFPTLYSLDYLTYRTSPLQLFLSSGQKLVLLSCDATDLTEENFIFHRNTKDKEKRTFQLSLLSIISLGILVGCVLHFAFLAKMNEKDDNDDETKVFLEMREKDANDDELLFSSDLGSVSSLESEMQESDSLVRISSSTQGQEIPLETKKHRKGSWKSSRKSFQKTNRKLIIALFMNFRKMRTANDEFQKRMKQKTIIVRKKLTN